MKGLINESIRVSVCCSLCVSAMQWGPDVPSLRAHRGKGWHCWQAWWMGGTPLRDKDECDNPRPAKGGRCSTTNGRSCDSDHLPFLVTSPTCRAQDGERTRGKQEGESRISDYPVEWLHPSFSHHILSIRQYTQLYYRHEISRGGGAEQTIQTPKTECSI